MAAYSVKVVMVVVVAVLGLSNLVSGHSLEFGTCKAKRGAQNFQPDQLTGMWYVIKIFSTNSRCMTITFNRTADGFTGTEKRELFWGRKVGLDHVVTNTGFFTIKDNSDPAQMRVRWPSNFLGSNADVTVVDIDPTSFAVLYECQSLFVVRRTSAVILSRQPTLEEAVVQRIEDDLEAMNIDVGDFDRMNHDNCNAPGEADFNFNVNEYIGDGFPRVGDDAAPQPDPTDPTFINFGAADAGDNEVFA